ncbi:defense protein Hdd11, partial [Biomphalaria glabrata]
KVLVWLTCLSLLNLCQGFGGGAPDGVCQSMTPNHNAPPQQPPSPYKVTTSKTAIAPGEQIE